MTPEDYYNELRRRVANVLGNRPEAINHIHTYPWLIGALGDPFSGVWFVAENPSLSMVERATNPGGGPATAEAQWFASKGDRLFRDALVAYGFKSGDWDSLGGWHCYITDVIKEVDYTKDWRAKSQKKRYEVAAAWADVLQWELQTSKPVLVVSMGQQVARLMQYLQKQHQLRLPPMMTISHYSYIAFRPRGNQGPMHPQRVREYNREMAEVAYQWQLLKKVI